MKPETRRIIDTIADFKNGLRELEKTNPELAKELRDQQKAVADCRRRGERSPLLDRRLD